MTDRDEIIRDFTRLYYSSRADWHTTWMGYPSVKSPTDLWMLQEIIVQTRPTLIIEAGTFYGGSALFYSHVLDSMGTAPGFVLTIDSHTPALGSLPDGFTFPPDHPRLIFHRGSSVSRETRNAVLYEYQDYMSRVMVLLDSQHEAAHVRAELDLWAALVTPGCYLVVEDTVINGHPVRDVDAGDPGLETQLTKITAQGGPMEALDSWLSVQPSGQWEIDHSRERHLLTYNPNGYLLRKGP